MKKINLDLKYLIVIYGLIFAAIIANYAHYGFFLVDCGREAYYPTQILLGKVLYKDIFNIYGPFSYLLNALLFKIFGTNLNVLYISGCVCAFSILTTTYLIARRFLNEFLSFSICVFTIVIGLVNVKLFNFIFTYSYGMLYGITAALLSLLLLLKYEQKPEKNIYLYLSGLLAGICVANKYEFLPYFLVIIYTAIKIKRLNFKQYGILIGSTLAAPIISIGILVLQGLRLNDLITATKMINIMAHTKTLNYFYQHVGTFFHAKTLPLFLGKFIQILILMGLLFYSTIAKKRIVSIILYFLAAFLILNFFDVTSLSFLPLLITLFFIFNFKQLRNNNKLVILTISTILLSMKTYWGLIVTGYGTYVTGLLLTNILALLLDRFKNKNINPRIFSFFLIIASIALCINLVPNSVQENLAISTPRGKIYPEKYLAKSTQDFVKYIQANTKKTDSVVIFPEGLLINFLTDRKSDDLYNSLIPLYVETFGEDKIIQHFKETKPEYIVFNNLDTKEYYFQYICSDYALAFCEFVAQNYTQEKIIGDEFRYLVFKLKNK